VAETEGHGALNTVSANAPLLELVNGPRPIDRPRLRRAVKDYSGIDWSPATSLLGEALSALWQADKSGKPVKQLLLHLDALKDVIDLERFKAQIGAGFPRRGSGALVVVDYIGLESTRKRPLRPLARGIERPSNNQGISIGWRPYAACYDRPATNSHKSLT
jgi:hypothetical protein